MRGSLPDAHAALYAALQAARTAHAPELNVYPLWRPDVALPAIWLWMAPGAPEKRPDNCTVRQIDRLVVIVGVDPMARADQDAARLIVYVQMIREALDPVLYPVDAGPPLDGQTRAAWAAGQQFALDRFGDVDVLTAELPVEITIDRTLTAT